MTKKEYMTLEAEVIAVAVMYTSYTGSGEGGDKAPNYNPLEP